MKSRFLAYGLAALMLSFHAARGDDGPPCPGVRFVPSERKIVSREIERVPFLSLGFASGHVIGAPGDVLTEKDYLRLRRDILGADDVPKQSEEKP